MRVEKQPVTIRNAARRIHSGGSNMRWLWALVIGIGTVLAAAQGGQGGGFGGAGGGQGPQGGGFGGGQSGGGDFASDAEEFRKTLFLTPGDRTEWEFEAKANETVLVQVTSNVFDAAVAIHDEKGAKLA